MKIASVSLENFKRHEKTEVQFSPGTNVISGPNYAGKSTILQAILFALFGAKAVPTDADDLVRRGAKRMRVAVILRPTGTAGDDSHYEIERTKSGATVTYRSQGVEEKTEATGHSAVTAWVENFVGLKAKRFAQLKYAEQKETEALLQFGTAELHALLEELSGADTVNAAIKRCSEIVSAQEAVVAALGEVSVVPDMAVAQHELAVQQEALVHAEAGLKEWEATKASHALDVSHWQSECRRAQEHNQGVSGRLQRLQDAQAALEQAQVMLSNAQAAVTAYTDPGAVLKEAGLEQARRDLVEVETRLSGLLTAYGARQRWETRVGNAREAVRLRQEQMQEAVQTLADAAALVVPLVQEAGADLETLEAAHQADFAELNGLKGEAKRLKAALEAAACPTCGRDYDEHAGHRAGMEQDLARVTAAGTALADRINARLATISALRKATDALPPLRAAVDQAKARLEGAREARQAAENDEVPPVTEDSEMLRQKVASLRAQIQDQEASQRSRLAAEARLAEARAGHEAARNRLAALPPAGATMEVPTEQLRHAEECLAGARARHTEFSAAVPARRAEVARLQAAIDREIQVSGKREEAKRRRDVAKELSRYLRENRDRFMGEIWASVMAAASGFVAACTGGDIERVYRDADGKFRYVEKGETFTAIGSASGAQRSLMGLGIKIAMSQLARSELNVVLLDEPSADMDSKVSAAMTALLGTLGQQVIMVSHREMDGTMADNVITLEG